MFALEVICSWADGPRSGERVALAPGVGAGLADLIPRSGSRAAESRASAPAHRLPSLQLREGAWWLVVPNFDVAAWLDGKRLLEQRPERWDPGSVLELEMPPVSLALLEGDGLWWPRCAALEDSIAAAPEAEARWLVYADWLQEQGDVWGQELARAAPAPTVARARALGPLARAWAENDVSFEWNRRGAPKHLQLRPGTANGARLQSAAATLRALGWSKAAFFVTQVSLGLAVGSFDDEPAVIARAEVLLGALAQSPPLPALRRLSLGQAAFPRAFPALEPMLAAVRRRHQRLSVSADALVTLSTALSLRVLAAPSGGEGQPQQLDAPLTVRRERVLFLDSGTGQRSALTQGDPGQMAPRGARLAYGSGSWRLFPGPRRESGALRLNGHPVRFDEEVLPGDEVELGPGLRLRVEE